MAGYQRKVFGCECVGDLDGLLFVLGQDEKGVLFQNLTQSTSARQGVHLEVDFQLHHLKHPVIQSEQADYASATVLSLRK